METARLPVFAKRLSDLRGEQSQIAFANFLGISRPTLSFYETGTRVPDIITLKQISEKCGVSTDWLLGLSNAKTTDTTTQTICKETGLDERLVNTLTMFGHRKNFEKHSDSDLSAAINYFFSDIYSQKILFDIIRAPKGNKEGDKLRDEIMQEVTEKLKDSKDLAERMHVILETQKKIDRVRNEQKLLKYGILEEFSSLLERLLKMTDWTEFDNLHHRILFEEMEEHHAKEI